MFSHLPDPAWSTDMHTIIMPCVPGCSSEVYEQTKRLMTNEPKTKRQQISRTHRQKLNVPNCTLFQELVKS